MTAIKATVRGGRLELDVPADWPDGTEVEIQPLAAKAAHDDETLPPEEVARILAAMDQLEPLDLSDAERAAWDTQRQARKNWEKSHFGEHAVKLQGMWE
ncbi:MAG: hypothetical protein HY040_19575 [Planctomycetes bacterium]|nr:hypothetical protein [Planctomycetota bacterium]